MRTGRSLTICRCLLPGGGVYIQGCLLQEVSAPGGVCSGGVCSGGMSAPGVSALGGVCSRRCLLWKCLLGGVCSGGCLLQGSVRSRVVCSREVSVLGGGGLLQEGWYSSMHWGRHPPCEQNDKQVQKYYLGHNFVAAGNESEVLFLQSVLFLMLLTQESTLK